jgi:hypothetical protein
MDPVKMFERRVLNNNNEMKDMENKIARLTEDLMCLAKDTAVLEYRIRSIKCDREIRGEENV